MFFFVVVIKPVHHPIKFISLDSADEALRVHVLLPFLEFVFQLAKLIDDNSRNDIEQNMDDQEAKNVVEEKS